MIDGTQKALSALQANRNHSLAEYIPLFREIGNTKRIRAAESDDSMAAQMFERAWRRLGGGENLRSVAAGIVAEAVVAANLGAIDRRVLRSARLSDEEIEIVLTRSLNAAAPLDARTRAELLGEIKKIARANETENLFPAARFVEKLKRQPRSGATKTGAAKRIFDQPENHAEHCLAVAVNGALLAARYEAEFETVFLIGLIHHFHNAYLPDSGFAGEEALGEFLPRVFEAFRRECLAELPENLHEKIWRLFEIIETAAAPEARAFHAADVIDRVLQMKHHAEANEFTLRYAMEEAELVHAGAVQEFHYDVLRQAKLIG